MPKYVVSTTLEAPEWANTHVIADNVVERVTELKHAPGQEIVQYGYGSVTRLLLAHDLLDELRLWVHPMILGDGQPERSAVRRGAGDPLRAHRRHAAQRRERDPQLCQRRQTASE